MSQPRNVVVILLDSLNRHLLGAYGSTEFDTPNLDRLAARSLRFDRHYTGSLPCMPARHDILCGALDFLWRPWGSIEVWEDPITFHLRSRRRHDDARVGPPAPVRDRRRELPRRLRRLGVRAGPRGRPVATRPRPDVDRRAGAAGAAGWIHHHYDTSRTWFRDGGRLPRRPHDGRGRPVAGAARRRPHERFLLFVDEFDPHEPFDAPEPWMSRYDPDWEGPQLIWPPYTTDAVASGQLDARTARAHPGQLRRQAQLIDHWLGTVLDALDRQDLWADTAVILCTDHGHYLGERDIFGKPDVPIYEPLGHIPLLIAWPGRPRRNGRRAHDQRRHPRHPVRRLRRHARAPHPRSVARPARHRRSDIGPRLGAHRRVGPRGPRDRRAPQVRPRARPREPAAVDVVEPLVDHADPRPARPAAARDPTGAPSSTSCRAPTCR